MAVELRVESLGRGPPVVVLHGLFGSGRNWSTVARALADSYRFHLVDLRNHGASPHTTSMTYTDMVEDVRALLDRRGLHAIRLVGHSMGGKAAMTMALNDPPALERVVVVDIAPIAYRDRFLDMITAMRALDLSQVTRRAIADRLLAEAIPEQAVRLFILQNLLFAHGRAKWRLNLATLARELPAILGPLPIATGARFERPVRFIRGERSDRITAAAEPMIAGLFPDYRIDTIAGGGHWPHAEAPAAFLAAFARVLRD